MHESDTAPSNTFQRFAAIVAKSLHVEASRITPDSHLEDLGAESLDLIEITMDTETEFGISMPEKSILQSAQEVFGPGVLEKDGVVTAEGKKLLRARMPEPEMDAQLLEGELTVKQLNRVFSKLSTWVRLIEGLQKLTPATCAQCGGELAAPVALRMKCKQCGAETDLPSGEDQNKAWVTEYYQKVYLPSGVAPAPGPADSNSQTEAVARQQ